MERITVARPYASAAFSHAESVKDFDRWSSMLLMASQYSESEPMCALYGDPRVGKDRLAELFVELCGDALDESGKNFIRLLVENNRISILPEICSLYEALRADYDASVDVNIIAALEVSPATQKAIAVALEKRFGKKVQVSVEIDSSLIGGAIIRAGDEVIDGSVKGRLQQLSRELQKA